MLEKSCIKKREKRIGNIETRSRMNTVASSDFFRHLYIVFEEVC